MPAPSTFVLRAMADKLCSPRELKVEGNILQIFVMMKQAATYDEM